MAGPWEDYAKPTEQQSEGPWNDYKAEAEPVAEKLKTEGTFDEHIDAISKKYGVSPNLLRDYAVDTGSLEAAESQYSKAGKFGEVVGKIGAGVAGVKESLGMGLIGKAERKIRGIVQGEQYEKALDEVSKLVEERKPLGQKVVEFGAGLALPAGGVTKAAGLGQKVLAGAKTGALTGAAAGLGASEKGEEISGTATGGALGGTIGVAVPLAGAGIKKIAPEVLPGFAQWDRKELIRSFMQPKSKEKVQEVIAGEQSKLAKTVQDVTDYAFETGEDISRVKELMNLSTDKPLIKGQIFKATSKQKLVDNISAEIEKLNKTADDVMFGYYEAHADELAPILQKNTSILVDSMKTNLMDNLASLRVSEPNFKKASKAVNEVADRMAKTNGDFILLNNLKKSLQDEVKQGYEIGKQLPVNLQIKKDTAAKLNEIIYGVHPDLGVLNKYRSALINYRDSVARDTKLTLDNAMSEVSKKIGKYGASSFVGGIPGAAIATADELLNSQMGKLLKVQYGDKAKSMAQKIINEEMAQRATRETIKEGID